MTALDERAPMSSSTACSPAAALSLELRHLRYFVALAEAGSFTHAAQRIFIAQPTLSQQIRRLEEIVGTPLLQRRREGLRLTAAGHVLLDASRNVLALIDHEVSRTRQAAGLGRQRLRMVIPPHLPERMAVAVAARLRAAAVAAEVEVVWLETALDAEFSLVGTWRADAGLGWLTAGPETLPAPLDAMVLGRFEPEVWVPSAHHAAGSGRISLEELAGMDVIHGPRHADPGTYDAWTRALQAVDPRFGFTDPPFRSSLPMTLAFAAAGDRSAAVLTGPSTVVNSPAQLVRSRPADACGMAQVDLQHHPLTASAALVWNGDLPRPLQQMLFDAAESLSAAPLPPAPDSQPRRGRGRQDVSLRLCRAVVRVEAMLAQEFTEPLDLIAQGGKGGPLPLAGGPVVLQLPFPVAQCRRVLEVLGLDGGLPVTADLCDLPVEFPQARSGANPLFKDRQALLDGIDTAEQPGLLRHRCAPWLVLALVPVQLDHLQAQPVQVRAQPHQHLRGHPVALAYEAKQDVLGADIAVAELQRLAQRELKHLLGPWRERDVPGWRLLAPADDLLDLLPHGVQADAQRLERLGCYTVALADEAEQDVLGADVVVIEHPGFFLR